MTMLHLHRSRYGLIALLKDPLTNHYVLFIHFSAQIYYAGAGVRLTFQAWLQV